jgi:hypothetical protein
MPKFKRVKLDLDCDDLLSKQGSRVLAEAIVGHWRDRGYLVFAEGYALDGCKAFGVRSNLVNGLPPKHLSLRTS